MGDFFGYTTRRLSSHSLELEILENAGPRIVRLSYKGSPNLFAELPGISVPTTHGDFHYLGGHRLWHAPEAMPRSYIPDEDGLTISEDGQDLVLAGKTEPGTGIRKQIRIELDPEHSIVRLTHTITNCGLWDVKLSAWALTMFRLGGTVIIPMQNKDQNQASLLPDRHFSLWPYSSINDPRLRLDNEFILLHARPEYPSFKIGVFDQQGWMAYWLDEVLFQKTFEVHAYLEHPDYNCNAETYADSDFVELESLAPLTSLAPGVSTRLVETWQLYDSIEQEFISEKLVNAIKKG